MEEEIKIERAKYLAERTKTELNQFGNVITLKDQWTMKKNIDDPIYKKYFRK